MDFEQKNKEELELEVVSNMPKAENIEFEVVKKQDDDFRNHTMVLETVSNEELERREIMKEIKNGERRKISLAEEILKIDSTITFEYSKTVGKIDYSKIKGYTVKDDEKTVNFLFYDNDFYAVNRINYRDGYMYSEKKDFLPASENLNGRIRKIPNVAKARNILHIDNIEARIYDITDYILLLERENIRIIKVSSGGSLSEMRYSEYNIDKEKLEKEVNRLYLEEDERLREERSIKNKLKGLTSNIKRCVVNPIKALLSKLNLTNDVKLLSDGKRSVFDKMGE